MTEHIFKLPDLGEGLTHAHVREIFLEIGQSIEKDQTVLTVETDKSLVDIPAAHSGKIVEICCQMNENICVGQTLFVYKTDQPIVGNLPISKTELTIDQEKPPYKIHPSARKLAQEMNLSDEYLTNLAPGKMITSHMLTQHLNQKSMQSLSHQSHNRSTSVIIDHCVIKDDVQITPHLITALMKTILASPSFVEMKNQKTATIGLACDDEHQTHVLTLPWTTDIETNMNLLEQCRHAIEKNQFPIEWKSQPSVLLSNFGTIAGRYGIPLLYLNSNVSIGIGQAFIENNCKTLPITLVFDHAVKTGGQAAYFLKSFKSFLMGKI